MKLGVFAEGEKLLNSKFCTLAHYREWKCLSSPSAENEVKRILQAFEKATECFCRLKEQLRLKNSQQIWISIFEMNLGYKSQGWVGSSDEKNLREKIFWKCTIKKKTISKSRVWNILLCTAHILYTVHTHMELFSSGDPCASPLHQFSPDFCLLKYSLPMHGTICFSLL